MTLFKPDCHLLCSGGANLNFTLIENEALGLEGCLIEKTRLGFDIKAQTTRGLLYGLYEMHHLVTNQYNKADKVLSVRHQEIRLVDYRQNPFISDALTIKNDARLLASRGVNAICLTYFSQHQFENLLKYQKQENLLKLRDMIHIFTSYGFKIFLDIQLSSPISVDQFEAMTDTRQQFWQKIVEKIYQVIPDFSGFLIKNNQEAVQEVFFYCRNIVDHKNSLTQVLKDYGGSLIYPYIAYD
ncbi:hypothetical protein [Lactococcus raffinolactis]|uniref:hypothetical protein n=1 Tax=Pseudolactococcus raffinolactis TaxID=1366 RepID=UPI0039B0C19E